MKPASAFLTASAREHAADERPASGPSQSMHVRTLGWHIESSTAEDLFSRLYSAVASIGTMQLSGDSFGSLIFTATVIDGPPAGGQPSSQEPMTALLWVVPSTTGHHVCIRRASGDTFIYHNFYRKVRQATAACQKRVFVSASRPGHALDWRVALPTDAPRPGRAARPAASVPWLPRPQVRGGAVRPPQAPDGDAKPPVCPRILLQHLPTLVTLAPQAMARCTGWREQLRVYETPQDATIDGFPGVACVPSCGYNTLGSSRSCRADSPPHESPLRECS